MHSTSNAEVLIPLERKITVPIRNPFIALTMLGALLLSGCSQPASETGSTSPSPAPSNSASAESAPAAVTGVEAAEMYFAVAVDTCNAAMESGVVETNTETGDKLIMVNKNEGYKDYSAVWVAADGSSEIIYEIDAFLTCGDAIAVWMLEENGEKPSGYDVKLSTVGDVTTAEVTRSLDGDVYTSVYTIRDGKIVAAQIPQWDDPSKAKSWSVSYGVAAADRSLLEKAVEAFLKENI